MIEDANELTPVERRGGLWLKRDDLFQVAGVRGGKARTCLVLADGARGLVTAGSRMSPQVNIVAHIARAKGIPCTAHIPSGRLSPEIIAAARAGARIVQHNPGYNTVIMKRAKDDAKERGWTEIPFGMECKEAVVQTRRQTENLPEEMERLVVPVGSGMSLAGILWGLLDRGKDCPVLGVCVGADPSGRLDKYAPKRWRSMVCLMSSPLDYHLRALICHCKGLRLDSIYEAKALPYLRPGDCLWVVGIRQTEAGER